MLFTEEENKNGYANYCKIKQCFEHFKIALKNDGFLLDKKDKNGNELLSENVPDKAKEAYYGYINKLKAYHKL